MTQRMTSETMNVLRAVLLDRQLLWGEKTLEGDSGINAVFDRLRCVQQDPLSPCGRNVDLVLHARVRGTHPGFYEGWLYHDHRGIEVYDKELSIVPVEDYPLCRGRVPPQRAKKLRMFAQENRRELARVLKMVAASGPVMSGDIADRRRVDIFWERASWAKVALDCLWKAGKLVIAERRNGRKVYDIPQRVYGSALRCKQEGGLSKEQVLRRLSSVGLLPASGTGRGWLGVGTGAEISPIIDEMIGDGYVEEIVIGGARYVTTRSDGRRIAMQEVSDVPDDVVRMEFLPPLDNLMWDRKMVEDVFGFSYRWEAYTPQSNRTYGHYVLPILFGTKFVGRIQVRSGDNQELRVEGLWKEPREPWAKSTRESLGRSLESLREYVGAERVSWKVRRPFGV